jgi:hypothetical protein
MKKRIIITQCSIALLTLSLYSATSLTAQTKEAVILYNSVPVEVEMDGTGDIKRFKKDKPKHLEGYTIDTRQRMDNEIRDVSPATNTTTDLLNEGPVAIVFDAGSVDSPTMRGLDLLNGVAAKLRSKTGLTAVLRAPQSDDPEMIKRHNGQLASCKNFLISQGIASSRITTTLSDSASNKDEVVITFE